ncbi:hypothetical protein PFISCL1PPCAC_13154, partial [Pristionchus fissidentatus]
FVIPISYAVFTSPVSIIAIYFVRKRLIHAIGLMVKHTSKNFTKYCQALTYQMLLPTATALGSVSWLLDATGIWSNEWTHRLVMTLSSLFAVGSPLVNLTFLPPYRRFFSRGK